jgi:hypothetical protein
MGQYIQVETCLVLLITDCKTTLSCPDFRSMLAVVHLQSTNVTEVELIPIPQNRPPFPNNGILEDK